MVAVWLPYPIVKAMPAALLQLVSNPLSGTYNRQEIAALVEALSCRGFKVKQDISSPDHPFTPDKAATHICVAGGDGTVRHVAASLIGLANPPAFSVYPLGTINLVAREWGAPRDPVEFASHVINEANRRCAYIVSINDTHFIACASAGPDSVAVAQVSEKLKAKIGRLAYGVSLAQVLIGWRSPTLTVKANGTTYKCGALYIANGRYYAGPWVVAPNAILSDEMLQIAMLKRARRRDFIQFLIATVLGRASTLANVDIFETKSLHIAADRDLPIQIDGDKGACLPATICVTETRLTG